MRKILDIIIIGGALILLAVRYQEYRKDLISSANWPQTQGTITRSTLHEGYAPNDRETLPRIKHYEPHIEYDYAVNGNHYHGQQITLWDKSERDKSKAMSIINQYPVGAKIVVYYNPEEPSKATLIRE